MEFKQSMSFFKNKEKEGFLDRIPSNSYFQKRLEAFLKTSPFKQKSSNPVFSKENLEKLKQALIPVLIMRNLMKLSAFQSLKHHIAIGNKYQKSRYLTEMKEIERKIEEFKKKPCDFLWKCMEKLPETQKPKKLLEITLKMNRLNAFYSDKTRHYFNRWKLINFENLLRKISLSHSEIIQSQIIDQLNNLYIAIVRKTMNQGFKQIKDFSNYQRKFIRNNKNRKGLLENAVIMINAVFREKALFLKLTGFQAMKSAFELRKAGFFKEKLQREYKMRNFAMGFKNLSNKIKTRKHEVFLLIKRHSLVLSENQGNFEGNTLNFKLFSLKMLMKLISTKEYFLKKSSFSQIIEYSFDFQRKTAFLLKILKNTANKLTRKYLIRWDFIIMKIKDPLISTKPKLTSQKSHENPTKSNANMQINKKIIINQALVNKRLELDQKTKAEVLLKLNQTLGLIEIETLISRKRRLYSRVFLNNLLVLGTFESKRYQEYEHYLKILQEEKEILHNELEEIENYNKKFAKHLDQKTYSIWGQGTGSGIGPLPATDEKSGQEGLVDHNSVFNEDNEEAMISINYLEFLEKQNVELREEVARNEQRIKHEEDKFESDLNMLKENIRTLQTKNTASGFKPKSGKSKLSDKKFSMIKSINSYFNKKSFTHDQDDSD